MFGIKQNIIQYQFIFLLIIFIGISCSSQQTGYNDIIEIIHHYEELELTISNSESKVKIVNFWATTCPPCLKEMPHFNEITLKYNEADVKVFLVSLDNVNMFEKRVIPFVEKHNLKPEVCLLADDNYSTWTGKIDPSWYGALPATIVYGKTKNTFKFGAYDSIHDLESDINKVME